jgi:hypothetical protein
MWLANQRFGLRKVVLLAAFLQCLCGLLRVIPCLFPSSLLASHGGSGAGGMAFIHIAQILNAACGPLVMATPTLLSQSWFGASERTTATAAAVLANNFGAAVGFVVRARAKLDAFTIVVRVYRPQSFSGSRFSSPLLCFAIRSSPLLCIASSVVDGARAGEEC